MGEVEKWVKGLKRLKTVNRGEKYDHGKKEQWAGGANKNDSIMVDKVNHMKNLH